MVGKKSLISGKSYTFFLISNYELSMKWGIFAYDDEGLVPVIPGNHYPGEEILAGRPLYQQVESTMAGASQCRLI
jgi:predicted acyltransferase